MGIFTIFQDVSTSRFVDGLFLSQQKYETEILDRVSMRNYKPISTLADLSAKFDGTGPPIDDPTSYHSLARALQYLTFTHPNITYVVQQICLYMHDPREPHFTALKRILCYIAGYYISWPSVVYLSQSHFDCLFRCRLGWVSFYMVFYIWLLCLSWSQPSLLVSQTLERDITVEYRS